MTQHWIRFRQAGTVRFGLLDDGWIRVHEGNMFADPRPTETIVALDEVKVLTPVQPSKVIAMWNNFRALGQKLGLAIPAEPLYLIKAPNSYLDPGEMIRNPTCGGKVVFEGELGIVIGRTCKGVSEPQAMRHVFGYTCANDVTVADVLNRGPLVCPMGPRQGLRHVLSVSGRSLPAAWIRPPWWSRRR
jgi:2-keto-4-pentenoate hydratase/2-oxohepta-3-ene-1,7-dioic acid hydratase (catechol pathway)